MERLPVPSVIASLVRLIGKVSVDCMVFDEASFFAFNSNFMFKFRIHMFMWHLGDPGLCIK